MEQSKYLETVYDVVQDHQINIDESLILDLLKIKYRWPKGHVETINMCSMTMDDYFDHRGFLWYEKWKELYDWGFPSHLNNVMDLTEDLRQLNKKLLQIRGSETMGNIYLSKGTTTKIPSFPPHHHDYHVIVKTVYGNTKWMIGKDIFDVGPNTTLMIPAGTVHAVVEAKEPRLSVTMNVTG